MKPIFIAGTGRSGTTILKRILVCHSQIVAISGELRIIADPDGVLDLVSALSDSWSPYKADIAIHRFIRLMKDRGRIDSDQAMLLASVEQRVCTWLGLSPGRYLTTHEFSKPYYNHRLAQLIHEICYHTSKGRWFGSPPYRFQSKIYEAGPFKKREVEYILAKFLDDLYHKLAVADTQTHWLDDTPQNLLHAHQLLQLFPEMKLIHIYRHPYDVMSSYHTQLWGGDDFSTIARRLAGQYNRWFEIREKLPSNCFLEIGLEALAEDPAHSLAVICEFIGLPFEPGLNNIPLNKVHARRWEKDIPALELEKASPYLSHAIQASGYSSE